VSLFSKSYLVVDLSNLCYRLHHVHGPEKFPAEFVRWIARARQKFPGRDHIYAVEGRGSEIRRRILPRYKTTRSHDPKAAESIVTAVQLLHSVDSRVIKAKTGEADDAIASWCHQLPEPRDVVVVTRDHDLWQIVGNGIVVMSGQPQDPHEVDRFVCRSILGVEPEGVALLKAMLGDKSDNLIRTVPVKIRRGVVLAATSAKTPQGLRQGDFPEILPYIDAVSEQYRVVCVRRDLKVVETTGISAPQELHAKVKPHCTVQECSVAARGNR
jgi:hypothetical protein